MIHPAASARWIPSRISRALFEHRQSDQGDWHDRPDAIPRLSNAAEGREDEFRAWYDDVHIPDLLRIPGIVSARRFELDDAAGAPHRDLVVYQLDGDVDEIMAETGSRFADGSIVASDALDMTSIAMTFWQPAGPRREAPDDPA